MEETVKKGIPSNTLKLIAILLMLTDHFAVVFEREIVSSFAGGEALFVLLRTLARIAFPLFAFFIAVGAKYTKNIYKYMLRLAAFALLSEIPFDLAFNGAWLEFSYQNVFFTLLMGLFCIFCWQKLKDTLYGVPAVLIGAGVCALAELVIKPDYGAMGIVCIVLFYAFMDAPKWVRLIAVPLTCFALSFVVYPFYFNEAELFAVAAAPLILLFNGQKGIKLNRWFFYVFYPAHLLLLWLIHFAVFR